MCYARDKFRNRINMGDLVAFSRQGELDVGTVEGVYKCAEDYERDFKKYGTD